MTEDEVRANAFAMPIYNPAFPPGPYRFVDREYLIIGYRTDPDMLHKMIPAPLKLAEPVVKFEFINMPDSTGFGHYCESGQVIPVTLGDEHGGFVLSMYLDDHPPIAAGRELWGFPKKLGAPQLRVHADTLMGTLDYSDFRVKGAWSGPGALDLRDHALAPVADLPVFEVLSTVHIIADLTLPLGTVVHDYLAGSR